MNRLFGVHMMIKIQIETQFNLGMEDNSMADNSSQIVEDVKWFMFGDESKEIKNENGFSHGLQFVTWAGDGQCFIVKDADGTEYRIRVSKEME